MNTSYTVEALYSEYLDELPGFSKTFVTIYLEIVFFIHGHLHFARFPFEFVGVFLNLFHLFILTRPSMRTSSVNVWLIAIAICDLIMLLYSGRNDLITMVKGEEEEKNNCTLPETYLTIVVDNGLSQINGLARKSFTWLGAIMALARLLIVTNPMSEAYEKLSKPWFAILTIMITTTVCSINGIIWFLSNTLVKELKWIPDDSCGYPANFSRTRYDPSVWGPDLSMIIVMGLTDGLSKIIPIISLPIITFKLVRFLKKAENARRKLQRNSDKSSPDNTTKLVTGMTISLLITEMPLALFLFCAAIFAENNLAQILINHTSNSWNFFVTLNFAIHCFICMSMSSQYRNCVTSIFPCFSKRSNSIMPAQRSSTAPSPSGSSSPMFSRTRNLN